MKPEELIALARQAKENAYAPYSHYRVGAALVTADGTTFTGVNVENASYGATICAERVAMLKAVSEGHRRLVALAIAADAPWPYPCGICRQVMEEFNPEMAVYVAGEGEAYESYTLAQLLPRSFNSRNL